MNSKHEAEGEVLRVAAHGLDAVIVNPTFVLGPDDRGASSMGLIKRFLLRRIPAYVDGGLNIVDVRDVADGHLLADAKGGAGRALHPRRPQLHPAAPLRRPLADLRRPGPAAEAARAARARPARCVSEPLGLPLGLAVDETRSAALWWTYSSAKAKRELGFSPRPHEETLETALESKMAELGDRVGGEPGAADAALELAAAGAAGRRETRTTVSPSRRSERESSSTAARRRPTSSVPAARSRGGCASSTSSTGSSGCPTARRGAAPEVESS